MSGGRVRCRRDPSTFCVGPSCPVYASCKGGNSRLKVGGW